MFINRQITRTNKFYLEISKRILTEKEYNILRRLLIHQQHFSGKDRKSLKIQLFTKRIAFEVMGSELIALLYESDLIKKHQPLYNRSQRRTINQYSLYLNEINGYKGLIIEKTQADKEEITSFSTLREAKAALFRITETYCLCQKINGLYKTGSSCFQYQIEECSGACIGKETPESYNERVDTFLNKVTFEKFTELFEVAGRVNNEKGLVYIENGIYKGFGFCPKATRGKDRLLYVSKYQDNRDVRRILIRYFVNN